MASLSAAQHQIVPSESPHFELGKSGSHTKPATEHETRVKQIADSVWRFSERGEQYRIYHGSTNTTRKTQLSRAGVVDTSGLTEVLSIDKEKMVAVVEPNVSMEKLADATLEVGLVPQVVMEFREITVGGGFAGTAGESSSFRFGLFDNTISEIEIVLPSSQVLTVSADVRPDLFRAAAGSFGTFGVITLLTVRLVEAKPYVELTYSPVAGMEEAVRKIENLQDDHDTEYLEGIMFGRNKGLIIHGRKTAKVDQDLRCQQYLRATDPWFYLRAEEIHGQSLDDFRELVPLKDYLFRYDRGAFWGGKYAFQYFLTPFNALTRYLLDSFMQTKTMYHAMHKSRMSDHYIVQDIGFPYATASAFIDHLDAAWGYYPLWLCPLRMSRHMSPQPRRFAAFEPGARSPGMMLNIGIWGPGPARYDDFVTANRRLERKTAELGGLKCFYAQAFYTPDEFWALYDRECYDGLRAKYGAERLPSVYQKVNVDLTGRVPRARQGWGAWLYESFKEQWPVRGVYGVFCVLTGKDYLFK
ncbi:hypothetical protein MBLNU230_g1064t1 [Neophaeotheca triangularis]